jgi:hypothetical protein
MGKHRLRLWHDVTPANDGLVGNRDKERPVPFDRAHDKFASLLERRWLHVGEIFSLGDDSSKNVVKLFGMFGPDGGNHDLHRL